MLGTVQAIYIFRFIVTFLKLFGSVCFTFSTISNFRKPVHSVHYLTGSTSKSNTDVHTMCHNQRLQITSLQSGQILSSDEFSINLSEKEGNLSVFRTLQIHSHRRSILDLNSSFSHSKILNQHNYSHLHTRKTEI